MEFMKKKAINIKDSGSEISKMDKELKIWKTEVIIAGSSKMEWSMGKDFLNGKINQNTKATGKIIKLPVKEFSFGKMEASMTVNG